MAVNIYLCVDANHAGYVVTRRSQIDIIVCIQNAPIIWFIKRQNTVEATAFGSKLVSTRFCKDFIAALRYKLQMFGVRLKGPAYVFYDDCGVVKNMSIPESVLHKKHNTNNYHSVCEAVAVDILRVGKEYVDTNLEDMITKVMASQKNWVFKTHILLAISYEDWEVLGLYTVLTP